MKNNIYKKIFRSIFLIVFFVFISINTTNAENSLNGNIIEKIEDSVLPSGTITYSTTKKTRSNVTTTLHLKSGERILNNNGNNKFTFTQNGSFTFRYLDINNQLNEVKAEVNNIVKSGENGDLQGQGYEDIHISTVTGRQFKEYRQNIDGWESKYPITHLPSVWSSGWRSECGSVSTITLGSGYSTSATFADVTSKLESTGGNTQLDSWVYSYTGQYLDWSYSYSKSTIANRLSNGEVAILHSTSSLVSSSGTHFMTLLDISEDKSKVYLSNPWMGSDYQGWITFDQLSAIFNKIGFVENTGDIPKYIDSGNDDDNTEIREDKIFFIGDSWMEILQAYEIAKSPNSYFYSQSGENADWVLDTYSSMNIPNDASCIVVEFGLNNFDNWSKTQELANKLANDYPKLKIFVLQTPHICSGYTPYPNFNDRVDRYNENMRNYCKDKERIIFINPTTNIVADNGTGYLKDEYAMDPDDTDLGGGKIHLNYQGTKIWYDDIVNCIKETSSEEVQLTNIKIKQAPSKTEYNEGENFSTSGMKVEAEYSDGTKKEITNYTVKNGNNLKANQTSVTISYTEGEVTKTVDQSITVNKKTLTEIKVVTEPTKKAYTEGESFNKSGMKVEAVYNNGTRKEITDYTISNGNNLQANQTSVTISYTEDGVTKTVEQAITVTKKDTLRFESRTYEITEENGTKYIEKVVSDTSIKTFKDQIVTNGTIKVYKDNQEITSEESLIATGMEIRVNFNNTEGKYIVVVTGDLVGKGKKDAVSLLKLARYNAKIDLDLNGAYLKAAEIYKDGKYGDIKDILKLSRELANLE